MPFLAVQIASILQILNATTKRNIMAVFFQTSGVSLVEDQPTIFLLKIKKVIFCAKVR